MKTKCPHCHTIQKAPSNSVGKKAKCSSCRKAFTITIYQNTPLNAPQSPTGGAPSTADEGKLASHAARQRGGKDDDDYDNTPITSDGPRPSDRKGLNIFSRMWAGIPYPFKTAFLATLGVVSALVFAWHVLDIPRRLNPPATTTQSPDFMCRVYAIQMGYLVGKYDMINDLSAYYTDVTVGYMAGDLLAARDAHFRGKVAEVREQPRTAEWRIAADHAIYVHDLERQSAELLELLDTVPVPDDPISRELYADFQKSARLQYKFTGALYLALLYDENVDIHKVHQAHAGASSLAISTMKELLALMVPSNP